MSGVPLPVAELKPGTVTVRVLRGSIANPIAGQSVEISVGGATQSAVTNEAGRAEFIGLKPGSRVSATTTIGGARLVSQEFVVPAVGGMRLMLVAAPDAAAEAASSGAAAPNGAARGAGDPGAGPAPPAQPGTVVFGDESRFVFEAGEDGLSVFYILHIVNSSTAPVQPAEPVRFALPAEARSATVLQGSSPQAIVSGRELKIDGPFAAGSTLVQLAYTMPYRPELVVEQRLPLRLMHLAVVAQKIGDMRLQSPQLSEQRDMPAQGNMYIAGRGGIVEAGQVVRFQFTGVPHLVTWPRTLAIVLAVVLLSGGAWASLRVRKVPGTHGFRRRELERQRDRLFDELTALELSHRAHAVDSDRYAERRRELVSALQGVYLALDDDVALRSAS
jgi:hypothetical protein